MYKKRSFILLPLLLVFLASCGEDPRIITEPSISFDKIIENKSSFDLILKSSLGLGVDSVLIGSGEEFIIEEVSTIGIIGGFDTDYCDLIEIGDLTIEVESSDSILVTLDPYQIDNWQATILQDYGGGAGVGECRLVIGDEDIE